jgi:Tol biopolymer transport system component
MADLQTLVQNEMERAGSPSYSFDDLGRRRDRKRRNQRITAGVVGIVVALLSVAALARAFRGSERPADQPQPRGIFSDVHGWIAYGNAGGGGIWAVNPTQPGHNQDQIQLSGHAGEPVAWSGDGSQLLIIRRQRLQLPGVDHPPLSSRVVDLFVLRADGTETRLTETRLTRTRCCEWASVSGGSFTPDGSQVVYAAGGNIYAVDSAGGTPQLLHSRGGPDAPLFDPVLSPDGTRLAYIDGAKGLDLRVMNLDGSRDRMLLDDVDNADENPAWSPDGSRLAFCCEERGIWVIRADGTEFTKVIPIGENPHWSPDGSRISYQRAPYGPLALLKIAARDGTRVTEFPYGESGPWNPLPLADRDGESAKAATGGGASPFVYVIVLVAVAGVVAFVVRARRRVAA